MIFFGEKLNSSIPKTREAFEARDKEAILNLAKAQLDGGANYLDLNTAMCENEAETMIWVARLLTEELGCSLMPDSPDPDVIEELYSAVELKKSIINSITPEKDKFNKIAPIVKKYETGVVAMPLGGLEGNAMPLDSGERAENADKIITNLNSVGIEDSRIYVDAIAESAGANFMSPAYALEAVRKVKDAHPDVHVTAGLSNVSFGLPKRQVINRTFLTLLMQNGLDSAILDTDNKDLMLAAVAAQMLLGDDEYCMNYLSVYRKLFE